KRTVPVASSLPPPPPPPPATPLQPARAPPPARPAAAIRRLRRLIFRIVVLPSLEGIVRPIGHDHSDLRPIVCQSYWSSCYVSVRWRVSNVSTGGVAITTSWPSRVQSRSDP